MQRRDVAGPINCVSPNAVRNRELTEAIAESLGKRVSRFSIPGFALRIALGEFGDVLLKGQRVSPKRLLDLGFEFNFPDLRAALADLLGERQ
jgi:NAD dependent epimerase/dehydratase family enzyme